MCRQAKSETYNNVGVECNEGMNGRTNELMNKGMGESKWTDGQTDRPMEE